MFPISIFHEFDEQFPYSTDLSESLRNLDYDGLVVGATSIFIGQSVKKISS